jgi:acyl carrier protein
MHDWTPRVIAILRNYMRDPTAGVAGSMALNDLAIDLLDLPLIYLDLEDAFDVDIDRADELEQSATVDAVIARIAARLAAKALPRPRILRPKGGWNVDRGLAPPLNRSCTTEEGQTRINHPVARTVRCTEAAALRPASCLIVNGCSDFVHAPSGSLPRLAAILFLFLPLNE